MSFLGKEFKFQSGENMENFVKALALPAEKAEAFKKFKPIGQKIEKNGDTYVFTFTSTVGEKSLAFTSGAEFEEKGGEGTMKSKITVSGNTVTHVMNFDDGITITVNKEFSETKMVEKLSNNKGDAVATVTYTA